MTPGSGNERALTRVLRFACDISAGIGGLALIAMASVTVISVTGRALFSQPIQGDVELVQLGCAIVVASFLPYTQFRHGNIIVDFFTTGVAAPKRAVMDAFGTLLYTLMMALICWRVAAGGVQAYGYEETSTLMAIPIWIPYTLMLPGFALGAVLGSVQTVDHLRAARAGGAAA